MAPLRIGVVGVGMRAGVAAHANLPEDGVVVARAIARSEASRARAVKLFGSDVAIDGDLEAMIAAGVDAAFVLSPDHLHEEHAVSLLNAGIPVFLEKPMAVTTEGSDAVLAAAATTGTPLFVGHNMRYMPLVMQMKRLIGEGLIGEPKAIWCRHFLGHGGDLFFRSWHADRSKSNSLLLQSGSHDLDVIHWLAGSPTRRVSSMGGLSVYGSTDPAPGATWGSDEAPLSGWPPHRITGLNEVVDVEDTASMLMTLASGVIASYQQVHYSPDQWRNYTIIGTEGRIENFGDLGYDAEVHVWRSRHRGYAPTPDLSLSAWSEVPEGYHPDKAMVADFLSYLAGEGSPRTTPIEARDAVAAGAKATDSMRSGGAALDVPPSPYASRWP